MNVTSGQAVFAGFDNPAQIGLNVATSAWAAYCHLPKHSKASRSGLLEGPGDVNLARSGEDVASTAARAAEAADAVPARPAELPNADLTPPHAASETVSAGAPWQAGDNVSVADATGGGHYFANAAGDTATYSTFGETFSSDMAADMAGLPAEGTLFDAARQPEMALAGAPAAETTFGTQKYRLGAGTPDHAPGAYGMDATHPTQASGGAKKPVIVETRCGTIGVENLAEISKRTGMTAVGVDQSDYGLQGAMLWALEHGKPPSMAGNVLEIADPSLRVVQANESNIAMYLKPEEEARIMYSLAPGDKLDDVRRAADTMAKHVEPGLDPDSLGVIYLATDVDLGGAGWQAIYDEIMAQAQMRGLKVVNGAPYSPMVTTRELTSGNTLFQQELLNGAPLQTKHDDIKWQFYLKLSR